jgi:hypothetical protein
MRKAWLVIALLGSVASGCDGCGHGLPPPGSDLSMPGDMNGYVVRDMSAIPPDATIPTVSYTAFTLHYAQALCAHYLACGELDQKAMDRCIEQNTASVTKGIDFDTEIVKGRMELNETVCIDAIKASRCDNSDTAAWELNCPLKLSTAKAFIPHQVIGAYCLTGVECMSGYCAHSKADGGVVNQPTGCPGMCADKKPVNSDCDTDEECAAGLFCDAGQASNNTHKCLAYLKLGDDCSNVTPDKNGCLLPSLYCPTFPTSGKFLCTKSVMQATVGGACDPAQLFTDTPPCPDSAYCKLAADGLSATCVAKNKMVGSQCDRKDLSGFAVAESQCPNSSVCYNLIDDTTTTAGTCQAFGGEGDPCKNIGGTPGSCKQGYYCDLGGHQVGTCKLMLLDGSNCSVAATCASNYNGATTQCLAEPPSTQAICQPTRGFGAACTPGVDDPTCQPTDVPGSTYCAKAANNTGVCAPKCF